MTKNKTTRPGAGGHRFNKVLVCESCDRTWDDQQVEATKCGLDEPQELLNPSEETSESKQGGKGTPRHDAPKKGKK